MNHVSLQELQKRAEELEKLLAESSANYYTLLGRFQEMKGWIFFLTKPTFNAETNPNNVFKG